MKRFNTVLLVLGLAFLLYLIEKTGWRELWLQLRVLGWGITLILLAEGLANLAHTVGWRHCIASTSLSSSIGSPRRNEADDSVVTNQPGLGRRSEGVELSLWSLFRMNMAGWAINYLTPTVSVGG